MAFARSGAWPLFLCRTSEYPSRILSRCSAIDHGTPVMSDGCHANISKFSFRKEPVHEGIGTSLFGYLLRRCNHRDALIGYQDSATDSHYSSINWELKHSVGQPSGEPMMIEISEGGIPRVIVYIIVLGYDGLPIQPVAPPSQDYIPGLEDLQTPPVP
ncbi:hypothetical protein Tco_0851678 [Tanacetum coccineum]